MIKKAWYILNYHDVSWEESIFLKGLGGTFPPEIFREHLEILNKNFRMVSVQEGWDLYVTNKIREPLISFWFDECFSGVKKYAYPLLEKYSVKGAISICSRFTLKEDFFWRLKLSLLSQLDGIRFIRSRLTKHGYKMEDSVKEFTIYNFSEEVLAIISDVYDNFTNEAFRNDAYRLFCTPAEIKDLLDKGWLLTNHSAAHYPFIEDVHIHKFFKEQFEECEEALTRNFNMVTKFWVIPFGVTNRLSTLLKTFEEIDRENRILVFVGNVPNRCYDSENRFIHRINVPNISGKLLLRHLYFLC